MGNTEENSDTQATTQQPKERKNIIHEFLNEIVIDHTQFKPNNSFYEKTGISAKRYGQLYRSSKSPTLDEIDSIARYFHKEITVITNKRQLTLNFDSEKE